MGMLCSSKVTNILQVGCGHDHQWRVHKYGYNYNCRSSLSYSNFCSKTTFSVYMPYLTTTKQDCARNNLLVVRAVSIPESADGGSEANSANTLDGPLQLGAMFCLWYTLNIYFNIYNKQVIILLIIMYYFL